MDVRSLGKAFESMIYGMLVFGLIVGIALGACGYCAAQKLSGYKVSIEKVEKK